MVAGTSLPYLALWLRADSFSGEPGSVYAWILPPYPEDGLAYLAWVKQAAQGAALLADGLAGGRLAGLVDHLRLREAGGTCLDGLVHPRAAQLRHEYGLPPG